MNNKQNIECKLTFDVPAGYFDNLADTVMQRIQYEDRRQRRRHIIMKSLSAAAAVIILAGLWGFIAIDDNIPAAAPQYSYADTYAQILESKITDNTVIEYITEMGEENQNSSYSDAMIEVVSDYPMPADIYYQD